MLSESEKYSLSKALKVKNRLAGRLARVQNEIRAYNSVLEAKVGQVDIEKLLTLHDELVGALVNLKTSIYEANRGIYQAIEELKEKKGVIDFLNGIPTRHGPEPIAYQTTMPNYVATLKQADIQQKVKQLEKEIDALQDDVDAYNARANRVAIDKKILELAS
jgi:hypothetical protein